MSALQGYRTQQKSGQPQYQTLQQVGRAGGGSYATDTVQKVLFEASTADDAVEAGSTKAILTATAHEALPGDMIRFDPTSANPSVEVGVISVTANTITLAGDLPVLPAPGDLFKVMRWITPQADANGNAIITSGPVSFDLDGVVTEVIKDTVTPANTVGLPVQIVGANGVDINITAGDINVQTSASGPNFDSMRIGDGTNLMAVNASLEATVVDAGANTKLTSIDGKVLTDTQLRATPVPVSGPLTDAQLRASAVPVSLAASPLPTGAATEAKQDVGNASLADIDTQTVDLPNVIAAEGGTQPSKGVVVMGHTGAGVVRHILVDNTGRQIVSVTASSLPTGAATEAKQDTGNASLASIDGKVLTDTQLRATPVPVSGPLTDVQLRAAAVPVSASALPLPTGAATEAKQDTGNTSLASIVTNTNTRSLSSTLGQLAISGTLTAPANVKGYTIQNSSRAAGALRFREGSGASGTVGFLLEPGQSTSYQDGAATLSVFDVDGLGIDCTVLWYV